MVKIGGVSLDVSHPKAFSLAIQKEKLDMRYTHSCKMSFRNDEEFAWFTKTFDVIPVEKIEDMVDEVDVGFIQSCNWQKHLDQRGFVYQALGQLRHITILMELQMG